MKKCTLAFFFLITLLLANQIQISEAFQETYSWAPCRIEIISSDDWQPATGYEVTVRVTLVSSSSYKWKTNSVKVILSSESFVLDSVNQLPTNNLTVLSDYWEKNFAFDLPSEKLARGQNFTLSIVALLNMTSYTTYSHYEKVWDNYHDPLTVVLRMPPLTPLENALLIGAVIATVTVVAGIVGFVVWRKRKKGKSQQSS